MNKRRGFNQEQVDRLKALLAREGLSQEGLALAIGISPQMVSKITTGKAAISQATAEKIHGAFPEYRVPWLLCVDDHRTEEDIRNALYREAWDEVERANAFEKVVSELLGVSFIPCPMPCMDEEPAPDDDEAALAESEDHEQQRLSWRHNSRSCDIIKSGADGDVVGQCSLVKKDAFFESLKDVLLGTGERWLNRMIDRKEDTNG